MGKALFGSVKYFNNYMRYPKESKFSKPFPGRCLAQHQCQQAHRFDAEILRFTGFVGIDIFSFSAIRDAIIYEWVFNPKDFV